MAWIKLTPYVLHNRSCLDENKAFLSTADSAVKLLTDATKPFSGWKGVEYRAAFPLDKPPGANFYPSDMDKTVHLCLLPYPPHLSIISSRAYFLLILHILVFCLRIRVVCFV